MENLISSCLSLQSLLKQERLTQPSPLAQLLAIGHLDQWDLVLAAQRHDQLLVRLLLACLVQHAHVGLAAIESLAGFAKAACETIVDEGDLQDTLQGIEDGHAAALACAVGGYLDLIRGLDLLLGNGGFFSVRLRTLLVSAGGLGCVLPCVMMVGMRP